MYIRYLRTQYHICLQGTKPDFFLPEDFLRRFSFNRAVGKRPDDRMEYLLDPRADRVQEEATRRSPVVGAEPGVYDVRGAAEKFTSKYGGDDATTTTGEDGLTLGQRDGDRDEEGEDHVLDHHVSPRRGGVVGSRVSCPRHGKYLVVGYMFLIRQ